MDEHREIESVPSPYQHQNRTMRAKFEHDCLNTYEGFLDLNSVIAV